MRANLVQNEPVSERRWREADLYRRLREVRQSDSPHNKGIWPFHDGPPYANGAIHLGHLLNKVLKDLVVRSRAMDGYDVPFTPGWDCHGLPIEHKVMTDLVRSGRIDKFNRLADDARRMAVRRECRRDAEKYVKLQSRQLQRLLTLADYEQPYLTMDPEYEAAVLEVFADMVAQGLIYRDLKPVHWSIANRTALAEAELEYEDVTDTSLYVYFEFADVSALARAFGLEALPAADGGCVTRQPALMIWTTTPWTLPANLAVAVNPRFEYALVRLDDRVVVLAEPLVQTVAQREVSTGDVEILARCDGQRLCGLSYRHPFCDRSSPIVAADYVTLDDGTGLVHTAPGHGQEDYQTGLKQGLDIYCPVMGDGKFDETVPDWLRGKTVWEANDLVLKQLRGSGHLYHAHEFAHSYPHDWRSKTRVIFRATEQWFVAVDRPMRDLGQSLRERGLEITAERVDFHPEWGRNRMRGMLESRPDWCLSRQRAWGLPIPAFQTAAGELLLTEASVRAVAVVVREKGSDVWFTSEPADLLKQYDPQADPDAPANLEIASLSKMQDIFDVWFESGSSWNAVMRRGRGGGYPAKLYLEGSDQHRGWFQLSLLCGLGSTGQSPFEALLTHGFMVGKDGRKMSKSGGNALDVEQLLKKFGADVCRWWVAGLNYENDIKVDNDYFVVAGESYRKVRNTLRFLLSNVADFQPAKVLPDVDGDGDGDFQPCAREFPPASLDAWVLAEYEKLATAVLQAYRQYNFRLAQTALYNFCNDTLSAIYLAAVKDRLYCDTADSPRRRRTQQAMSCLLEGLTRLLAPILPHTADEAYRSLRHAADEDAECCVHLTTCVASFGVTTDAAQWCAVMQLRDRGLQALEQFRAGGAVDNPLDAEVRLPDTRDGVLAAMCREAADYGEDFLADLADLLGVSRVVLLPADRSEPEVVSLLDEARCERSWKRDGTVRKRSDGGWLSDRDAAAIGLS